MKDLLRITSALLTGVLTLTAAYAQPYPERPVRLIVPWPAGGAADSVARAAAAALSTELGRTVYVDNVAGAGGTIGTQQFIRSAPDGYTLLLATSSTNSANPHLNKKAGFDPVKDFTPVASLAVIPSVLVVPAASPYKSPKDLIAAAKAAPGTLAYGSGGVGSSAHLGGELFKSLTKTDIVHVPYRGSAPALSDVISGRLELMFDTGAFPHTKGGKLRALAVAADKRSPLIPDVPTFVELGIKGMVMNAWYGVAAPANMSPVVVTKLNAAINRALRSGDLGMRLADIGAEARISSPDEFSTFWRSELARYERLVKLTGATLD